MELKYCDFFFSFNKLKLGFKPMRTILCLQIYISFGDERVNYISDDLVYILLAGC